VLTEKQTNKQENLATTLKTILSSLAQTVVKTDHVWKSPGVDSEFACQAGCIETLDSNR